MGQIDCDQDGITHNKARAACIIPGMSNTWLNGCTFNICNHGPLARYVKLRVAHAPGMPGPFPPPSLVSDPDMHHGACVTHVPWCMSGLLTSGLRNPQIYISGKRPIASQLKLTVISYNSVSSMGPVMQRQPDTRGRLNQIPFCLVGFPEELIIGNVVYLCITWDGPDDSLTDCFRLI